MLDCANSSAGRIAGIAGIALCSALRLCALVYGCYGYGIASGISSNLTCESLVRNCEHSYENCERSLLRRYKRVHSQFDTSLRTRRNYLAIDVAMCATERHRRGTGEARVAVPSRVWPSVAMCAARASQPIEARHWHWSGRSRALPGLWVELSLLHTKRSQCSRRSSIFA